MIKEPQRCETCGAYLQEREIHDPENIYLPGPVPLEAYRTPGPGYVVRYDLKAYWSENAQESYKPHVHVRRGYHYE